MNIHIDKKTCKQRNADSLKLLVRNRHTDTHKFTQRYPRLKDTRINGHTQAHLVTNTDTNSDTVTDTQKITDIVVR